MKTWKDRIAGFAFLYALLGIWTPLLWFMSYTMRFNKMESLTLSELGWFSIAIFAVLTVATVVAQLGLVLIANQSDRQETR